MKPYYLLIILSGILMIFCASGLMITGFSPYLPYLIDIRGYSNTQISFFIFLRTLTGVLVLLPVHRILSRFGLRQAVFVGMLLCTAAFLLYGLADNYIIFCSAGALAGAGYSLASFIPVTILITKWFHKQTGLMLGICMSSSGLGAFIGAPVITKMIESWSLTAAFISETGLFVVCSLFLVLVVRDDPAKAGLAPYGAPAAANTASKGDPSSLCESEDPSGGESRFASQNADRIWIILIMTGWFIFGAPANSLHFNLSVLYQSVGSSPSQIAAIVSIFGISLAIGKCICGFLSDWLGVYKTVSIFFISTISGNALCCISRFIPFPLACTGSVLIGFGLAVATVGCAPYAMRIVTEKDYAKTVSRFQFALTAGGLIFSLFPGIIADLTGDYVPAYVIMLVLSVISFVLVQGAFHKAVSE